MKNADNEIVLTCETVRGWLLPRREDAHKNMYGHLLLVCGSRGMSGAAILATGAALRSGCGLVTTHLPESERFAIMARYPSAMLSLDPDDCLSQMPVALEKYSAVGIGCGLGTRPCTKQVFQQMLEWGSRQGVHFVIDADGLNLLAQNPELKNLVPHGSVLTPHDGELERLVGKWHTAQERRTKAAALAAELGVTVVAKGPNSLVCSPYGNMFVNTTGNSGMAKGGSGDILTGLIAGLVARGYAPVTAACVGVWLHGSAGDMASRLLTAEAMNSADILDFLPRAWKLLE